MGELKSAWEIAQERAHRLGKLSAEEQEQQKSERCRQAGHALAQKWLDGAPKADIAAGPGRYDEGDSDLIRRFAVERLLEEVEFAVGHKIERAKKAIEGIGHLKPGSHPHLQDLERLVQEYEAAEHKLRQQLESGRRETLHRMRISGTAIAGINIDADPQWQSARRRLAEAYAPKLKDLKQALIS